MNTAAPLVHARNVRKSYGDLEVLKGIDLDVAAGQVVCIIGPSGSGKSTFLRCINHLEQIDSGLLAVGGVSLGYESNGGRVRRLSARRSALQRREIGMVFQGFNLFPHLSVLDNIELAPVLTKRASRSEARSRALELLAQVGLSDKAGSRPDELSGGQQQRAAIARALAMQPELMLFDEPTSALDPELVGEVLQVMRNLADSGMTMIVVTHEIAFAEEVADVLVLMDGGVVVEHGSPTDVIRHPSTERGAQFLRRITRAREQ